MELPAIKAFVDGVTASAIRTIAGAVVILGKKSLIDIPTILIAIISITLLWKYKKITEHYIIIACAVIGFIFKSNVFYDSKSISNKYSYHYGSKFIERQ